MTGLKQSGPSAVGEAPRLLFVISVGLIAIPVLREQIRYLRKEGVDVHVAAAPDRELYKVISDAGGTFHEWGIERSWAGARREFRTIRELWRIIRNVSPQILISGTPKAGLLGVSLGQLQRIPRVIYTLHGLRLEGASGWHRCVLWLLEFAACRAATVVHAVGPELADRTVTLKLAAADHVVVVGQGSASGINTDRFRMVSREEALASRAEVGLPPDEPVIGFVGRVTHDKGVQDLAHLARHLRCRGNGVLAIVGEADRSNPRDGRLVTDLLSLETVVPLGHRSDMPKVFPAFDVLVLPSKREGLPTVVLEAAACGVPAVMYNCTGAGDAVIDGLTGKVCGLGDTDQLVQAIEELLADADLRRRMSCRGRSRVEHAFDTHRFLPLLADFYLARGADA